jgi:predicted NBD/HSP70 family sugar kinase
VIVIGGGVSNAWEYIEPPMRAAIRERAMAAYSQRCTIVRSLLGDEVGLLGAVALALQSTS